MKHPTLERLKVEIVPMVGGPTGDDITYIVYADEAERLLHAREEYIKQLEGMLRNAEYDRIYLLKVCHEKDAEITRLRSALERIANKATCEALYPGCEKYKSYEDGWEGVAHFARKALEEEK